MQFGLGLLLGGMIGGVVGVVVMSMCFVSKGTDKIIADLYEILVEWTELADNIHLGEHGLYDRSIKALNRAQRR